MTSWLMLVLACGGDAEPVDAPVWHGDVQPLVTKHCRACHTDGGSGPFTLDSYADATTWAEASLLAIEERRMPPWLPAPDCRSLFYDRTMPTADIERFAAWVEAGTPEGDPVEPVEPEPPVSLSPTHVLTGTDGYVSGAIDNDDYRCFVLDGDFPTDQYLVGSQVAPGTPQVHHVLVYALTSDQLPSVLALDAADETSGYGCFGDPYGDGNDTIDDSSLPIQIASWVPGNNPAVYPPGMSVRIPAGSKVVMQVHYSAVAGDPVPDDGTTVELLLQDEPTDFLSTSLPLPILSLDIPAGQSDVSFSQRFTNYGDEPIEIGAMAAHMHLLGDAISAWVVRSDGTEECALDIPEWDFGWQQAYAFAGAVLVNPGDEVEVRCSYDNSVENQPVVDGEVESPRDVGWGDGTLDEMCIIYIATKEPWTPTPDLSGAVCGGLETCTECDSGVDCGLSCEAAGGDCGLCTLEAFETCSVASCGFAWLPVLDCLEDCVVNAVTFSGSVGDCLRDRCTDASYETLVACLDETTQPGGVCEGALDGCPVE